MHSLFTAAPLGNFTITVYIRQAAAYLKICEANGAAPSSAAVALINLYQLILWWREVQIYIYRVFGKEHFHIMPYVTTTHKVQNSGAVRHTPKSSGDPEIRINFQWLL